MARRKSTGRRVLTIGLVGIGIALLLVITALVVVTLPPGERIVRGLIEDQLSSALYQPVEVGDFETDLLSRIRLENVRIHAREPDSGGIFIKELELHYRLRPLLRQTLAIESVRLDSAEVTIVYDSVAGYNLPILDSLVLTPDTAAADTGGGFALDLGPIDVRKLDLRYIDRALGLDARLPGIALRTDSTESAAKQFVVTSEPGTLRYGDSLSEVIQLSGQGRWADTSVIFDTLSLTLGEMRLGFEGTVPLEEQGAYKATAMLIGDPSALMVSLREQFDLPELATDGLLRVRGELSGSQTSPQAELYAELPTIRTEQATLQSGYLLARATIDTLIVDSLYAQTLGGTITAEGGMAIDSVLNGKFTLAVHSIDLPEIFRSVYDSAAAYEGKLNGTASIVLNGNDWAQWDITTDLRATNLSYNNGPLRDLNVDVNMQDGRIAAEIRQQEATVTADVGIADSTLDGTVKADIRDLEPLAGWLNLRQAQGSLQAEANLSGTFANPTIEATISGERVQVNGVPADTVEASVRWADSSLFVNRLVAYGAATSHSLNQPLLGVDSLLGSVRYRVEVSGRPDSLVGNAHIDLHRARYGSIAVDSAVADVDLNGRRARIDTLVAVAEGLVLRGQGAYNLATGNGNLDANIWRQGAPNGAEGNEDSDDANGADGADGLVAQIESRFQGLDTTGRFTGSAEGVIYDLSALEGFVEDTLTLGGSARFSVSGGGPMDTISLWEGDLNIAAESPRYNDFALDSIRVAASLENGLLAVENLAAFVEDQSAQASGQVQLVADTAGLLSVVEESRTEGSLRLDNFDVSRVQPFLPEGTALAGTASADLEWNGTTSDPNVRGNLGLRSGRYAWTAAENEEVIDEIVLIGTLRDSTLVLDTAGAKVAGRALSVTGSVTLVEGERIETDLALTVGEFPAVLAEGTLSQERLDFTARIDSLNLQVLQPFVPDVERLEGVMNGRVDITGTAKEPVVGGRLVAEGITLRYALVDRPFTDGYFAANFTGDSAVIDSLWAKMEDGWVTGSGSLSFDTSGITDMDMRISGRNLEFTALKNTEVVIDSANFTYTHPGDYYLLQGVVDLGETRYTENFQPTAILPFAQEVEQVETELPVFLARTRLDVRLTGSDSLWIDNNLASLRMNAELQFLGFVAQPQVAGRLSAEEGYVLYLDRKFDVTEGVAFFTDPSRINPELTLRAETDVTSYRRAEPTTYDITLMITGRLQDPTVELASEPPLTQPDIIAVLTLGATRGELAGQTGEILEKRAGAIASQQISGFASARVGDLLGLDRITVSGNIFDVNDTTGPEIIASERISEDVTLEYRTTVGHLNDQRVSVNWQFHRRWLLEGTTNRTGRSSLNLTYILRMR